MINIQFRNSEAKISDFVIMGKRNITKELASDRTEEKKSFRIRVKLFVLFLFFFLLLFFNFSFLLITL
jgi:hypothetical protein